jgi:hypothetical protein
VQHCSMALAIATPGTVTRARHTFLWAFCFHFEDDELEFSTEEALKALADVSKSPVL